MNEQRIISEIETDIKNNVYKNFPKLEKKLTTVASKMSKIHKGNRSYILTPSELEILFENEYLKK